MKNTTKKLLSLLLVGATLFLLTLAFASCGNDKKVLKLGFDADYPPYGYLDAETDTYKGFDLELAAAACEAAGYELKLVPIDWNAKDALLQSGAIDCIWSGFTMDSIDDDGINRLEKYAWTGSYSDNSIVVLVKGDSIKSLADLAGKGVMVQAGSSGEAALKDKKDLVATFDGGNYNTIDNYTNAFAKLDAGSPDCDAIVIDIGVAKSLIEGKTGYTILSSENNIASEQYGVAFRKADTALRDTIWNAVLGLDASVVAEIAAKYDLTDSISIQPIAE